jgi:hypothetical protein
LPQNHDIIVVSIFNEYLKYADKVFMKKLIVKKDYVTEVQGVFEYLVEKFNLAPMIELLNSILEMILSSVNTYPMLVALNKLLEKINSRLELFRKVSIL